MLGPTQTAFLKSLSSITPTAYCPKPVLATKRPEKQHAAFFRQSGWLMIANFASGAMSWAVHFLNKKIPDAEYSVFGALLMVTACVPVLPLQMVFAQQSAMALAKDRVRQLAGLVRLTSLCLFGLWAAAALVVLLLRGPIISRWQLPGAAALCVTLLTVLVSFWWPMFTGLLQGRQDFFWMGWTLIIGGAGRIVIASVLVLGFAGGATAMMTGAMIGIGSMAAIACWRTRDLWAVRSEAFDARESLGQILPLMLGFGACQFLFTSDTIFAKAFFSGDAMKPYVAAGTLSRALLWAVLPLAAVMFPKLVHGHAKSEKTNLFGIVVLGTGVLAVCGMLGLWIFGPWVVKLVYKSGDVDETMRLIPWYAGAMVPLALANVLVNDLLARARFRVVPAMVTLAVAYGFALVHVLKRFPGRLEVVLQTLGAFNFLLLVICAWFTLRSPKPVAPSPQSSVPAG
jgi:O-antigen/teichoic acid export membrane protein